MCYDVCICRNMKKYTYKEYLMQEKLRLEKKMKSIDNKEKMFLKSEIARVEKRGKSRCSHSRYSDKIHRVQNDMY